MDPRSRPRLGRGVRLRLDRITGKALLLRPEQGFELQGSAVQILELCTAELTIEEIVDRMIALHQHAVREQIANDVQRLLSDLSDRGLVQVEAP
jgi:pyrroloquinoline quinone biosynthesis protein D